MPFPCYFSARLHSSSLKPTKTRPSPTRIGRLMSFTSCVRSVSFALSDIVGSLSLSSIDLKRPPDLLKKLSIGSPLSLLRYESSSTVGVFSFILRALYSIPLPSSHVIAFRQPIHPGRQTNSYIFGFPLYFLCKRIIPHSLRKIKSIRPFSFLAVLQYM